MTQSSNPHLLGLLHWQVGSLPLVKSEIVQSCLTLCNPVDCSLPDFSVHGIFQVRVLEWVAIPSPGYLPNPGIELRSPTF